MKVSRVYFFSPAPAAGAEGAAEGAASGVTLVGSGLGAGVLFEGPLLDGAPVEGALLEGAPVEGALLDGGG